MKGKVVVAMSGGVDSSVSALLLHREGWDVIGAELQLHKAVEGESDAAKVCKTIGIPYSHHDLREPFKAEIMDYFCSEYLKIRTPNPCVMCNQKIKFGLLADLAKKIGASYLATGHYARIEDDSTLGKRVIKKGLDLSKDQSYALFAIRPEILKSLIFPMGTLEKAEARKIARDAGLHVENREESQDICFLPEGDYGKFITDRFPEGVKKGPIINREGQVLGEHKGLIYYTIGQRRGIGVAAKDPYYVVELRCEDNTIVIGSAEDTRRTDFEVSQLNWHAPPENNQFQTLVKIRYNAKECPAEVRLLSKEKAAVRFKTPQKAITPGQAAVFYDQDIVLGGGWIMGP